MFIPTVSAILLAQALFCDAAVDANTPAAIIGTYNVTFAIVGVPSTLAYSLVPAKYRDANAILPPDPTLFPALETGELPVFLELGREADAGPPLLNFANFQEAKIEVPNVKRLDNSPAPFLYKRLIAVDSFITKIGSLFQFGLNTTEEIFVPVNSSNAPNHDYTISNILDATFEEIPEEDAAYPLSTYQSIGSQPWFAEYLTCAQHFYNFTSLTETKFLSGSVTLYPPYAGPGVAEPVSFRAHAVRGIYDFKIVGPLACELFV